MDKLHMPIDDINKKMRFNSNSIWENYLTTNCYAFALGMDIPENEIIQRAYQPGTIGSIIFDIKLTELIKLSLEEKIFLDLKALNISYSECQQSEISSYYFDSDYEIYQWIIALFYGKNGDFHFMKKSWDNVWWHKRGYNLEKPINYDDNFEIIYNPEKCKLYNYEYVKCLKLSNKQKINSLYYH